MANSAAMSLATESPCRRTRLARAAATSAAAPCHNLGSIVLISSGPPSQPSADRADTRTPSSEDDPRISSTAGSAAASRRSAKALSRPACASGLSVGSNAANFCVAGGPLADVRTCSKPNARMSLSESLSNVVTISISSSSGGSSAARIVAEPHTSARHASPFSHPRSTLTAVTPSEQRLALFAKAGHRAARGRQTHMLGLLIAGKLLVDLQGLCALVVRQ